MRARGDPILFSCWVHGNVLMKMLLISLFHASWANAVVHGVEMARKVGIKATTTHRAGVRGKPVYPRAV